MYNKKNMFCASVLMLISVISLPGQAADKQGDKTTDTVQTQTEVKKESKDVVAKVPIVIDSDHLSFSDLTGDLLANGHVILTRNTDTLATDHLRGNTKQTEIWIDGKATLQQPGTKLIGIGTHYNYTSRVGNMQQAQGKVGKEYISGEYMDFSPKKIAAHDGTVTRCPAIIPDYHISAEKVEVWPGEKMIAYNAKFWLGKTVIYATSKYETSLLPGEQKKAFPRVGYSSSNGVQISQYMEHSLTNRLGLFADLTYYSKQGFIPNYGIISRQNDYTLQLYQSKEENGDNEWIKREPELLLKMKAKRFGKVVGDFTAARGKWTEGAISGWRQDYKFNFSRDPIELSSKVTMNFGGGFEKIHYGYNNSDNNIWSFNTTVMARPNERLETWVGYSHYNQSGTSVYAYDKIDIDRELTSGFMYKVDKRDAVGIKMSYDIDRETIKDVDYTWRHNLHCWDADITYRAKRGQLNLKVSTVEW